MRILHVTRDFPPRSNGGISTAVGGLVDATGRAGIETAVISFDNWRPSAAAGRPAAAAFERRDDGVMVLRLSSPGGLAGAAEAAEKWRPALLHVHHGMLWPFAARLREALGIRAVKSIHVVQARMNALRTLRGDTMSLTGQRCAVAEADAVHVPSRAAASALLEAGDDPICRPVVIPFGVSDSAAARQAAAARRPDACPAVYLTAGRFDDVKGTGRLAELVRRVLDVDAGATFLVAGGLPANRRRERKWHRQILSALPAPARGRVCFTGWLAPAELARLYAGAGAFFSLSRYETFGQSVREAMLFGLPVAALEAGGLADCLRDGDNGRLVGGEDIGALAAALTGFHADPAEAYCMGQAAAAGIRRRGLWPQLVAEYVAFYRRVPG